MNINGRDAILLAHSMFGVLGTLSALWVFVEALSARQENSTRIRTAALATTACMVAAWIFGGYWYVHFYPGDKAMILKGPWPFAHNLFMETKEHLFFVTLILSLYLSIAARDKLHRNEVARKMVLAVAMLTVLTGLGIEGCGAIINHGAELAFRQASSSGAER